MTGKAGVGECVDPRPAGRRSRQGRLTVADKRQWFEWLAERSEKRERKRELSGDSPEKANEAKAGTPNVTDAMARTATTGFLTGA